jgi:hypothetical protein
MLKGQDVVPCVAVPEAAHGIVVSLCVAAIVPASVIPPEQAAWKSPVI